MDKSEIVAHTQSVIERIGKAEDVGGVMEIVRPYRTYAQDNGVALAIRRHVEGVVYRRITALRALAKSPQITSPRKDRSASFTDRMLGEGEK